MEEGAAIAKDIAGRVPIANAPLFASTEKTIPAGKEIVEIPPDKILDFPDHPFKARNDDETSALAESIAQNGQFDAAHVRPSRDKPGYYEAITGHRRREACAANGMDVKCIVHEDLSDEEAIIMMVDSNLRQRENILVSERALAYKMKLDAIKKQGQRNDLTSRNSFVKLNSADKVGEDIGITGKTVQRYIRYTNLIPEFLDHLDNGKMQHNPAYEISFLSPEQQWHLHKIMEMDEVFPSHAQAKEMHKISETGSLSYEQIHTIMNMEKGNQKAKHVLKSDFLDKYFQPESTPADIDLELMRSIAFTRGCGQLIPRDATPEQAEETAAKLLKMKDAYNSLVTRLRSQPEQTNTKQDKAPALE